MSGSNLTFDGGSGGSDTYNVNPGSTVTIIDNGGDDDTIDFGNSDEGIQVLLTDTMPYSN